MGENSSIQWTDHTFNPWIGCQRVSPGCVNCYAEAQDNRWRPGNTRWGPKAPRTRTSTANWRQPLKWNRDAEAAGVRARVFCASLADVFEDRAELAPWRADLFKLVQATPWLDWLLLTKRPEHADRLWNQAACQVLTSGEAVPAEGGPWLHNIWLGTTVEDQQRARERIPHLLATPAAVRFLSVEPQIEEVSLGKWLLVDPSVAREAPPPRIDWVIQGGESGPGARPFNPDWARRLAAGCKTFGTAYFLKQLGAKPLGLKLKNSHGGEMSEWPVDLQALGRAFPVVVAP